MNASNASTCKAAKRRPRGGRWRAWLLLLALTSQGAKLQAENIALDAAKAIHLSSAQNSASLHSSNSSSSFGGGATLGLGEQSGISAHANAGQTLRAVIDGCRCLSLRRPNGMTTRHPQAGLGYMHEQWGSGTPSTASLCEGLSEFLCEAH
jgi:hypothetical protein